ncbi:putative inactive dual specificity protein phosphatase-like [Camellia lanceoleosa]|uniref:Inactive dual specificity protein phosphatase-like n=1 Tax=Camellia lanceoleosa TaxID=1840588 RepID=A0ACC0G882_9ERIC|nr:putative inactive dual specificity protein phosphatase-like [Camellia lanceoleosa]
MFQENHKHPLGGIRRKAATLSISVMRLSAHPSSVEAVRLMTRVEEGALEGKLLYVHCEAHLDYFNYWSGIQCSCCSWITPDFQLYKS